MIAMALDPAIADTSTALKVSSALPGDSPPTDVIRAIAIASLVIRSYASSSAERKAYGRFVGRWNMLVRIVPL
jgi:hypothetical protein